MKERRRRRGESRPRKTRYLPSRVRMRKEGREIQRGEGTGIMQCGPVKFPHVWETGHRAEYGVYLNGVSEEMERGVY